MSIIAFILFLVVFIILFVFVILGKIIGFFLPKRKSGFGNSYQQQNSYQGYQNSGARSEHQPHQHEEKVFSDDVGEYVSYEEIKEE